jgi:hypothetical protein
MNDSKMPDLSNYVLAENVTVTRTGGNFWDVTFDWLCPNCRQSHHGTEFGCHPSFQAIFTTLDCGQCYVRMPWARTPVPNVGKHRTHRSLA